MHIDYFSIHQISIIWFLFWNVHFLHFTLLKKLDLDCVWEKTTKRCFPCEFCWVDIWLRAGVSVPSLSCVELSACIHTSIYIQHIAHLEPGEVPLTWMDRLFHGLNFGNEHSIWDILSQHGLAQHCYLYPSNSIIIITITIILLLLLFSSPNGTKDRIFNIVYEWNSPQSKIWRRVTMIRSHSSRRILFFMQHRKKIYFY